MNPPRLRLRLLPLVAALTLSACGGDDAADAPDADGAADAPAADALDTTTPLDLAGDEATLASYTLTMERVEGWHRAVQNLQRLAEENPTLAETWETDETDPESFDEMIAQIEAEPPARRAIEQAGSTPRDYVLTSLALLQAMFAQAAMDMGQGMEAPEGVNPANVQFVREHQAEIQAMFETMEMEE